MSDSTDSPDASDGVSGGRVTGRKLPAEHAAEELSSEPGLGVTSDRQEDAATASSAPADTAGLPSTQILEISAGIEVNGLQATQISVLQEQHARGLIDVQRKASELKVDIQALDQTLESLTSQARSANDAGVNITATHTQNTSLGQTEIIVGNTQRAAAGKVTPVWSGLDNPQVRMGLIAAGALVVGVLLAALFS